MRTTTCLAFCLLLTAAFSVHAERRVALVIGNGAYEHAPVLRNPVQDARAIAAALGNLGYGVQLVTDAKKPAMEAALAKFAGQASGADQAVVYYSGHGIEVGGVNYLLPVEASIASEATVPLEAVSLPTVMGVASRARQLGLVVLDACRDNPLGNSMERSNGTRGATRGLGAVEPTGNLLVAYATKDGRVAADGTGVHSPYTAAILDTLKVQGLEVQLFWRQVHDRVLSATSRAQEPFTYGALGAEALYLNPPAASAGGSPPPAAALSPPAASGPAVNPDEDAWSAARDADTAGAYQAYLKAFPHGVHAVAARIRLAGKTEASVRSPVSAGSSSTDPASSASEVIEYRGTYNCQLTQGLTAVTLRVVSRRGVAIEGIVNLSPTGQSRVQFAPASATMQGTLDLAHGTLELQPVLWPPGWAPMPLHGSSTDGGRTFVGYWGNGDICSALQITRVH
jgi:uncharacterized caspase-like protein